MMYGKGHYCLPKWNVVVRKPVNKHVKESCEEHFLEKLESSGKWCFWPQCPTGRTAKTRAVSSEFKECSCSDSVLKGTEPDQLAGKGGGGGGGSELNV